MDIRNINVVTVISFLMFLAGILFYIYWGMRFGVWADVGIYSITVIFVLSGLLGMIISLYIESDTKL